MMHNRLLIRMLKEPLEEEVTPHSSTLAWRIPWTDESGGLQSVGPQRVGHDCATEHTHKNDETILSESKSSTV